MVRLRLYETLMLLPAQSFEGECLELRPPHFNFFTSLGSYTHLLRMLVAEFTLTENPANTTTSQLRTMCHADDSVILGTWLQETDHRTIEDQVSPSLNKKQKPKLIYSNGCHRLDCFFVHILFLFYFYLHPLRCASHEKKHKCAFC